LSTLDDADKINTPGRYISNQFKPCNLLRRFIIGPSKLLLLKQLTYAGSRLSVTDNNTPIQAETKKSRVAYFIF